MERAALERLKWHSRRGLLELDLVFQRFWKADGLELTDEEGRVLAKLLEMPDNDLLDLVMGRVEAPGGDLGAMVEKLRAA